MSTRKFFPAAAAVVSAFALAGPAVAGAAINPLTPATNAEQVGAAAAVNGWQAGAAAITTGLQAGANALATLPTAASILPTAGPIAGPIAAPVFGGTAQFQFPTIMNYGPTGPLGPLGADGPLGNNSNVPTGFSAFNFGPTGPLGPGGPLG
jgi:hypothetical protein